VQGLRERNKALRRQQILLAARQLIIDGGLEALTMRSLSGRAQLSVPTIYNLVGSRDAVLAALFAAGARQFEAAMAEPPSDPLDHALLAMDQLTTQVTENRNVVRAVLAAGLPTGARHRDSLFGSVRATAATVFHAAKRAGVIHHESDGDVLSARLEALIAGAIVDWAVGHGRQERLRLDLHHSALLVFAATATADHRRSLERELRRCERALRAEAK